MSIKKLIILKKLF